MTFLGNGTFSFGDPWIFEISAIVGDTAVLIAVLFES
jgi:hypothetical protein